MIQGFRRFGLILVTVLFALVAACSSGDDSAKNSAEDAPSNSEAQAEAKEIVAELTKRPELIPATDALENEPSSGKTAVWIECSIPDCEILRQPLEDALGKAGWDLEVIDGGITPEEVKAGWQLAVQREPDAVISTGFPTDIYSDELATLEDKDIPVVLGFVAEENVPGVSAFINGIANNEALGSAFASWIVAEAGDNAKVLYVTSSSFSSLQSNLKGYEAQMEALCPDCTTEVLDAPAEDIGTPKLAQDIVAKLRADEGIDYVVASEGNMLIGLAQSFETAGIDVPVIGQYPSEQNIAELKTGDPLKALVIPPVSDAMWDITDALFRAEQGMSVEAQEQNERIWIATPETADDLVTPYSQVVGYEDEYVELWGVG